MLGELLKATERRLKAARLHYGHGTHNAREEAGYLVFGYLGWPFDTPLDRKVPSSRIRNIERLVRRRISERLPAAYLVKKAWLGELEFYVDRRVIVPRSFIAELLRDGLQPWLRRPVRRVLDLCTGSGCLAIAAAHAFPRARVDASDVSCAALEVARLNVERHRLKRRVRLLRSDLFEALAGERYDVIVSNPPYVTGRAMRALPAEYRHEPVKALSGGESGLVLVSRILREAREHLTAGGLLVCEIGHNQRALERAYPGTPFLWPELSAGAGHVFVLGREHMPAGFSARKASASRSRATRARAPS
jgi:ribosomal protein L3 glutamine methyltransferase